jgi:uncharacterized protein
MLLCAKRFGVLLLSVLVLTSTIYTVKADDRENEKILLIQQLFDLRRNRETLKIFAEEFAKAAFEERKKYLVAIDVATKQSLVRQLAEANTTDLVELTPSAVKIYAATLTQEELRGIVDFYKSPAGQSLLKKLPVLDRNIAQMHYSSLRGKFNQHWDEITSKYRSNSPKL